MSVVTMQKCIVTTPVNRMLTVFEQLNMEAYNTYQPCTKSRKTVNLKKTNSTPDRLHKLFQVQLVHYRSLIAENM